jgi:hypothetical protein
MGRDTCARLPSSPPSSRSIVAVTNSVYLGDRILLSASRTPLLDAARELMRIGADPDALIVMRRVGTSHDDMRARLATAAGLTVEECSDGRPRFRPYRPRLSEGSPPAREAPSPCAKGHNVRAGAAA